MLLIVRPLIFHLALYSLDAIIDTLAEHVFPNVKEEEN